MSEPIDLVLDALRERGPVSPSGSGWVARCPAHEDHHPSLTVGEGREGVVIRCQRGCPTEQVLAALGLQWRDLFPPSPAANGGRTIAATYDYVDEAGELLYQAVRFAPKEFRQRRPTENGWEWKLGDSRRVLYRLPDVLGAIERGETVYVAEGEKDVEALLRAGVAAATCNAMGAGKWRDEYAEPFRRHDGRVVIVADRDEPGRDHARKVRASLLGANPELDVGIYQAAKGKDAADHLAAGLAIAQLEPLDEPEPQPDDRPFALSLADFIADPSPLPQALVGDADDVLLPHAGLLIEYAKGGRGKTTLTVDFAFHAASGVDWLGFQVARPLRILFVENEGPRESFRAKLEAKLASWPHPLTGALYVHSYAWGALSFAEPAHREQLRSFIEAERIDVVIGDPLDSLGLTGVGSPEDTRLFLGLLAQLGLFRDVAFVLLHHPRKETTADELDEAAGAWGGRPDTMLRLARQPGNRARLSFPKFRWSRRSQHPAMILSFEPETASFVLVAREDEAAPVDRDVTAELVALMADQQWHTLTGLAGSKEKGGIGARREQVTTALTLRPDLFAQAPGSMIGLHGPSTYWRLRSPSDLEDGEP